MQIIIDIDKSYSDTILTLLKSLKRGMVKEVKIVDDTPKKSKKETILNNAKGVLKHRISDPVAY